MRAFVVEDNEGIREIVVDLLIRRGHTVDAFATAESAHKEIGGQEFGLAVLDWGLPGMDGLDLCRHLRSRPSGELGVIIVLTGRAEPEDIDEVVSAGASDYVTKPFKLDTLEVRIAFAERHAVMLAEQARARRELKATEDKYQALVESVPAVTYIQRHGGRGEVEYISPQVERILGWSPDMFTENPTFWIDIIHADDKEAVHIADQTAQATGSLYSAEYRQLCRNNEYRWFRDEAQPICDERGDILFWHGVISDITDRKLAHEALRESDLRQREMAIATKRQAVQLRLLDQVRARLGGELELTNVFRIVVEATAEVLGYRYTSLYMRHGDSMVRQHQVGYPESNGEFRALQLGRGVIGRVAVTGEPRLIRNTAQDPDFITSTDDVAYEICVPLLDEDVVVGAFNIETTIDQPLDHEDLRLLLGVAEHVNAAISRSRLYREAQSREALLRSVLDNVQEVVFQTDRTGRWTFLNTAWEEITGYAVEDCLGCEVASFGLPEHRETFQQAVDTLTSGLEEELRGDFQIITKTGEIRWVEAHAVRAGDDEETIHISGTLIDITERRRAEEALRESQDRYRHLALHDPLTTLPNRMLFMERLEQLLRASDEEPSAISVLFLDLDGFKLVNDTFGHECGDDLLIQVGRRLLNCSGQHDTVARLGGDEFAILLNDNERFSLAMEIAQRILDAVRQPFTLDGQEISLATSIGIAGHHGANGSASDLLRNADTALYVAKANGRGAFAQYQPQMSAAVLARFRQENELRRAIENGEIRLVYQPSFDLRTGEVTNVEALVRWEHPEQGLLTPCQFLSLAETTGLIVPMGSVVLETICRDSKLWMTTEIGMPLKLSVNLSARQMRDPSLIFEVERTLSAFGILPELLDFDISEAAAMNDGPVTNRALHELRELGVGLTIDDFGTGSGTLSSLRDLPVNAVKIDRGFIVEIGRNRASKAIVRAMTALAQTLNMSVTAEGIETIEQLAHSRAIGIDRGQGYYFSHPMTAEEIEALIARNTSIDGGLLLLG